MAVATNHKTGFLQRSRLPSGRLITEKVGTVPKVLQFKQASLLNDGRLVAANSTC